MTHSSLIYCILFVCCQHPARTTKQRRKITHQGSPRWYLIRYPPAASLWVRSRPTWWWSLVLILYGPYVVIDRVFLLGAVSTVMCHAEGVTHGKGDLTQGVIVGFL